MKISIVYVANAKISTVHHGKKRCGGEGLFFLTFPFYFSSSTPPVGGEKKKGRASGKESEGSRNLDGTSPLGSKVWDAETLTKVVFFLHFFHEDAFVQWWG